ncbi:thiol reductant ABC exporter subunit CydC [Kineosporia succinea]|uniref:ATP-binding cassette subfamily C protein CydC n=1 Tax=Kineosporia succinea TaxID=84632 RepID=A0ABT9NW07_9ACTN|nr:thiol reductant ABC exporter subunit CydC [Kineosporia succinea]MDP9824462.1 ATP-binding cassette subfamily C protein CydC [Kineosporia succinea]
MKTEATTTSPVESPVSGRRALLLVLDEMRPDPWRLLLGAVTGAAAVACSIALLGVSGWLITRAAQQPPILFLMVAIVGVRAFGIGRGVLRYCERLVSHDVALRGVVRLRETLFGRLAAADDTVAAGLKRGDLLARLGADVDELGDVIVRGVLPFVTAILTGLASVVAVGIILPEAGAVLATAVLIAIVAVPGLAGIGGRRDVLGTAQARTEMSENVLALFDNLPELTVSGRVPDQLAAIRRSDDELSHGLDRAARPASWAAGLGSAVMSAAVLGSLVTGVIAVNEGRIREVALAVLTFVPLALAEVVAGLPAAAVSLVRASEAARRVVPLLATPEPDSHRTLDVQARPVPNSAYLMAGQKGLRLVRELPGLHLRAQDLAVGWPGREPAVRGVNLDLTAGRRIAVVGPSGQGKSTLLRTLAGLLPAAEGHMLMDDTDVGDGVELLDVHTRSLRHMVHLAADDAHVFGTTVRENLRVANKDATDPELLAALRRAGLGEWISGLGADGLDVVVGDPAGPGQGAGTHLLSGGIRRRMLMARAFVSGAPVLLVDEPAEHLDAATADDLVAEVLASPRADQSAVVVTHRLSPLAAADEVLVIDGGVVAARGTHDELIATYAPYRSAWAAERREIPAPALS